MTVPKIMYDALMKIAGTDQRKKGALMRAVLTAGSALDEVDAILMDEAKLRHGLIALPLPPELEQDDHGPVPPLRKAPQVGGLT